MNFDQMNTKQIKEFLDNLEENEIRSYFNILEEDKRVGVNNLKIVYEKRFRNIELENIRLEKLKILEKSLYEKGYKYIAGVDEVGRGPLAGPCYIGCVLFPENIKIDGINDSKKLSPKKRESLYYEIKEKALAYTIISIDNDIIDEINILNAVKRGMIIAVERMEIKPDFVLVDGNQTLDMEVENRAIVKGDSRSISIAAASILAKVARDRYMEKMDLKYPGYDFLNNKGYGTKEHIFAIQNLGITEIHRKTFCKNFI